MKLTTFRYPRLTMLLLLLALIFSAGAVAAQALNPPPDMTGRFAVRYGDALMNGKMVSMPPQVGIYEKGVYYPFDLTAHPLTDKQIHNLFGKEVNLYGLQMTEKGLSPQSIAPALLEPNPVITGVQPWAQLLCSFKGSPTPKPHPKTFYEGLFRGQFPSIENYWETMTNGAITGLGPHVFGWYDLGGTLASFKDAQGNVDLGRLWDTCTAKADADVFFPDYVGVSLFFDADLGAAWGGASESSLDGQTRGYRSTWYPNYDDPINFLTHEIGHGYNMNHSSQSSSPFDEYQDPYTQMSAVWLKCDTVRDPTYGCIPLGLDSWDLFQGGWVRVKTVDPGQYKEETIEPLYINGGKTQALVLRLNDTQSVFVETRKLAMYDAKLFFGGVVLHAIDTSTYPFARLINVANNHDDTTKGALLTAAGKKYTDPQGQFTICLNSISGGNYSIAAYVGGDCSNPPPPPTNTPVPTVTPTSTPMPTDNVFETVSDISCSGNYTVTVTRQVNVQSIQWTINGKAVDVPSGNIGKASTVTVGAKVTFNNGVVNTYTYPIARKVCTSRNVYLPIVRR